MSLQQLNECNIGFVEMAAKWSADTAIGTMRSDLDHLYFDYQVLPDTSVLPLNIGVPAEKVVAANARGDRAILCLHGGGFSMGSARAHRSFASYLSRASFAQIITIDYRLVPEHIFPAQLDDAVTAYGQLLRLGFAADQIAISGDSAGGGLALATMMRLRDEGQTLPACAVLLSPWLDMRCRSDSCVRNQEFDPIVSHEAAKAMGIGYVGAEDRLDDPLASPILGNFQGLPPIMVQLGSYEIFLDEALIVAERITAAGGSAKLDIWPCMTHQFQLHPARLDEAMRAIENLGGFLRQHMATDGIQPHAQI